jgi:hypothetical protein
MESLIVERLTKATKPTTLPAESSNPDRVGESGRYNLR